MFRSVKNCFKSQTSCASWIFNQKSSVDFLPEMIVKLLIFLIGVSQSKSSCPFRNKRFAAPENPGELWQPEQFLFRFNHSLYTAVDDDEIKLRNQ